MPWSSARVGGAAWNQSNIEDYPLHESDFQSSVFEAEDTFDWTAEEPCHDRVQEEMSSLGLVFGNIVDAAGPSVSGRDVNAVKAIVFVARLQESETGVPQGARLTQFLGLARAHVDGGYTCGKMLEWTRCYCLPLMSSCLPPML